VGRKAVATVAGGGARQPSRAEQGVAGRSVGPAAEEKGPGRQTRRSEHDKIGRNEPCWCGSGKKYKLCHGR
jgi:preprotein translocase subunit SecA